MRGFLERWWYPDQAEPWWRRALLAPLSLLSLLWRAGTAIRRSRRQRRALRVPPWVVSVGNLNVGGAGKTPAVIFLARWAVAHGARVAVLSRGYGRQARDVQALPSGGGEVSARDVGDEPLLIARSCPEASVWVGPDRAQLADTVSRSDPPPDLILLDDGFQHWQLARDQDLVVVDASVGFGNGRLLPRGPLREPPAALGRATALWVKQTSPAMALPPLPALPRLVARHRPWTIVRGGVEEPLASWAGRRVVAFAGLARPGAFFRSLEEAGMTVVAALAFPDHHLWSAGELAGLERQAASLDAVLITTEKDAVRLPVAFPHSALRLEIQLVEGQSLLPGLLLRLRAGG